MSSSLLQSDTQLNQSSYYEASVQRDPAGAALQGAVHADVLIVGAGFAGLSAALELAIMSKPDVLVMRLELPEMSANEVLATLRRLPATRAMPVVVYGIATPDALIEHVAQLDLDEVVAIKDCAADKVVNAALSAAVQR